MLFARSSLTSVVVVASLAVLGVLGCSGKDVGSDLYGKVDPVQPTPGDAGPDVNNCADFAPACDPGDDNVGSEANCAGADYCYSRSTGCGDTLVWCAHRTEQCNAHPGCDAGDSQVTTCPAPPPGPGGGAGGYTCYARSACGTTIQCLHQEVCKALPACNPGDLEVMQVDTCNQPGVKCYSVSACNVTIHCYTP
jgi:hypothetical protein